MSFSVAESSPSTKHGITFEEASEVYLDEFGVFGDASRGNELREYLMGYSYARNLLFVVFIERRTNIRVISARLATRGTSVDALVRLYIGQCLRKDLSELFKNTVLQRTEEILNQCLDSDHVSEVMQEIRSPYQ